MRIQWLNAAITNLDNKVEYIAQDNPKAAELIVKKIVDGINLPALNPTMGQAGRIHGTR